MPRYMVLVNYKDTSGRYGTVRLKVKAATPEEARAKGAKEIKEISQFSTHQNEFDLDSMQVVQQADAEMHEGLLVSRRNVRYGFEVWALKGAIDAHTNGQFEALFEDAIMEGTDRVVLDCQGLDYINSSGIGTIVNASSRIAVKLANVTRKIEEVFAIVGLTEFLEIYHSVNEAIDAF